MAVPGLFALVLHLFRQRLPKVTVEVLIPDFKGDRACLQMVLNERPDVLNHNIETVPRLYHEVRPQADYQQSLTHCSDAQWKLAFTPRAA